MQSREVILYLAIKYNGDWEQIYSSIRQKSEFLAAEAEQFIKENKSNYVTILDEEYPKCFKNMYRPPFVLFYKGDLSLVKSKNILGVVGTRKPSSYGLYATRKVLNDLNDNIIIASGLAKGIDSEAHKLALKKGLKTIAFLGCGINYIYPAENYQLYKDIEENGLILSEYPNMVPPDKQHFPIRNRLIAACSKGVLAVEAKNRSGTSSTITAAASFGKTIYAVVNPITDENDSLPNDLIRDGAIPVVCSEDINEDF